MKSEEIKYVLEVAKQGSIHRAAKALYISQPKLSISIKRLEEELGFEIFDRNAFGVELTKRGIKTIQYLENIQKNICLIKKINDSEKDYQRCI